MTTGRPHQNMLSLSQLMPTLKKTGILPCAIELSVVECTDVTKPTSTGVVHVLEGITKDERCGLPLLTLTDGTAAIKALEMRTSSEPQFTQGGKIRIARGAPFKKDFLLLYSGCITVLERGSRPLHNLHKKSGSDSKAPPFKPYPRSHHGHSKALPTIGTASDIHQNNIPANGIYRWGMHGSSEGRLRRQASTSQRLDRHARHGEVEAFKPNCTDKVNQDTHYGWKDSYGAATQLQAIARPTNNNQRSTRTDFQSNPTRNNQTEYNTVESLQRRPTRENQGRSRPPRSQYTVSYNQVDYLVQHHDNTGTDGALLIFLVVCIVIIVASLVHSSKQ